MQKRWRRQAGQWHPARRHGGRGAVHRVIMTGSLGWSAGIASFDAFVRRLAERAKRNTQAEACRQQQLAGGCLHHVLFPVDVIDGGVNCRRSRR